MGRTVPVSPEMYHSQDMRKSPYDMWKEGVVTQSNTVKLGVDKDILYEHDQAPKDPLTKVKGNVFAPPPKD